MFASKNIKTVPEDNFKVLVQQCLTQQEPIIFPFEVQLKLAERFVLVHRVHPCKLKLGDAKSVEDVTDWKAMSNSMAQFARALCPDSIESADDAKTKFDLLKPNFSMVLHGLAKAAGVMKTAFPLSVDADLSAEESERLMQQVLNQSGSGQLVAVSSTAPPTASSDQEAPPSESLVQVSQDSLLSLWVPH